MFRLASSGHTHYSGEKKVTEFRVIAIPTKVAKLVQTTQMSPGYGHPAHTELATGYGPCRHCLRTFRVGEEQRILFTYDPFYGIEQIPLPGPVYVHAETCKRYHEEAGYPDDMLAHAAVLQGYAKGQRLIAREIVEDAQHVAAVQRLLAREDIDYIEVRDKIAGCYDFRIERKQASDQ
jgi:hypothetical protein